MEQITSSLLEIVGSAAVAAAVTIIAVLFKELRVLILRKIAEVTRNGNDTVRRKVVGTVVRFVEQVFNDIDGTGKYNKAFAVISQELTARGIPFHDDQIKTLIESEVYNLKNGMLEMCLDTQVVVDDIEDGKLGGATDE